MWLSAAVVLAFSAVGAAGGSEEPSPRPSPAPLERCEAASLTLFGERGESAGLFRSSLKRVRGALPRYPKLPRGTRGSGQAIHEMLIGPDGAVHAVWTVREPALTPPFPPFGEAIVTALRQWRYEPHRVSGRAVPVCLMMTTTIHWR